MCGRFTNTASPAELMRHFGVTILENLRPRWNVAPAQSTLVIRQRTLHAEALQAVWGLPPATPKQSFLINARMETAAEKPTFRAAFAASRCLVPATGWYEWSAPKQPWHIQYRDGGPMAMGGLLLSLGGKQSGKVCFVIMTSPADGDLQAIHHRAPLVLPQTAWHDWLTGSPATAAALLRPAAASLFNWYRVGAGVGRVAEDHPGLVTPLTDDQRAAETAAATSQGDLFS